jgi:hypothetical protein
MRVPHGCCQQSCTERTGGEDAMRGVTKRIEASQSMLRRARRERGSTVRHCPAVFQIARELFNFQGKRLNSYHTFCLLSHLRWRRQRDFHGVFQPKKSGPTAKKEESNSYPCGVRSSGACTWWRHASSRCPSSSTEAPPSYQNWCANG